MRIARTAERFQCTVAVLWQERRADGRSVYSLLGLVAPGGAQLTFVACGPDAAACLDALAAVVETR